MRRVVASLALLVLALAGLKPAVGSAIEDDDDCSARESGRVVVCDPEKLIERGYTIYPLLASTTRAGAPSSNSSSTNSRRRYVPYNRLSTDPNGEPCVTTGYVEEGRPPPDELLAVDPNPRESNIPDTGSDFRILETYPPCPERPRANGEAAPIETRALIAARVWERVPLPTPAPFIAPGRAITGKVAYLETGSAITHTHDSTTTFGPLHIAAKGSFVVDWGDGTTTGPHSFEGKPWPNGQITHEYMYVGKYDVVVTEKWTATWSLDGESGVLRTLQTTGTIDDFPVEQIQAVIQR